MVASNDKNADERDVLVVEDDPEINRLVGAYVEIAGFRYVPALNGSQAMAQVRDHVPSAVVLDLMLPDVSGWEICRKLRANFQTRDVPVIILTALDSDESRRECMRCGASAYLTKPFDPETLLVELHRYAREALPQQSR